MEVLDSIFSDVIITDINSKDVLEAYAAIDSFSQGGPSDYELGTSARNMGKNDLWIAATASVLEAILIPSDKDFEHLDRNFLTIGYLGVQQPPYSLYTFPLPTPTTQESSASQTSVAAPAARFRQI